MLSSGGVADGGGRPRWWPPPCQAPPRSRCCCTANPARRRRSAPLGRPPAPHSPSTRLLLPIPAGFAGPFAASQTPINRGFPWQTGLAWRLRFNRAAAPDQGTHCRVKLNEPERPPCTCDPMLLAALLLLAAVPRPRPGADQGHRRRGGHPGEPAGRLRPRRRAERHRRPAGQCGVHPAVADRHAGAAGRQHARPGNQAANQERGRGDGDRHPARLRPRRQPHRRERVGAGRRQGPDRGHPARHPADGRRWRGLQRGDRARCRPARSPPAAPPARSRATCRRPGGSPTGRPWRRKLPFQLGSRASAAARPAQPRPHHGAAHRRRHQRQPGWRRRPRAGPAHRGAGAARVAT